MHHPAQQTTLGQPVTVSQEGSPTSQVEFDRSGVKVRPQLPNPEVTTPTVVVPPRYGEPNTPGSHIRERRQGRECVPGDHPPVLKPEIEQVPVDHQVVGHARDGFHEGQKGGSNDTGSVSQVGIGNDGSGFWGHGGSIWVGSAGSQPPVLIDFSLGST